ncbi:PP2C family protein-serine/threonine phosphatase [Streptomyces polygonati]|uniref:PP2C family protein-serine/threonine phosphatase n=1 Tax=Streptomyces polygonati TaxID=1617087 RepID=A0ABV8HHX4_9ACTN
MSAGKQPHQALVEEMGRRLEQSRGDENRLARLVEDVLGIGADLDLMSVLTKIVEAAARAVDARHGALGVLDEHGEFSDLITTGVDPGVAPTVGHLPHGEGLLGELVREPGPIRVPDLAADPRAVGFPPGHPVMRSLLGAPIHIRGTVYGNLYLTDRRDGHPFSAADESMLVALASVAGGAIENARHHDRLQRAAEELQRRLLPELPDIEPLQVQARYHPALTTPHVGGDWYQAVALAEGVRCVVVGDVMGHDTGSALTMHKISSMLYVLALDQQGAPSRVVQGLDRALHRTGSATMASLVVATLRPRDDARWVLRWTNAGHPPPLVLTPRGEAVYLDTEEPHGMMIGVDPAAPQPEHERVLEPGSTLLLYTDGLVEDPRRTLTEGLDDLAERAAALSGAPLDRLCDALTRADDRHRNRDDIALMAIRLPPSDDVRGQA